MSFCLTDEEIDAVDSARQRLGKCGIMKNRSEVVRCAINALSALSDADLVRAATHTVRLKPGRKPEVARGHAAVHTIGPRS
jgi:Arc/MetJ-type ribon-helix-helix transcriptional regulator